MVSHIGDVVNDGILAKSFGDHGHPKYMMMTLFWVVVPSLINAAVMMFDIMQFWKAFGMFDKGKRDFKDELR